MNDLSAHLNWLFADDDPVEERLEHSAAAGADAYGWNPWAFVDNHDEIRSIAAHGAELGLDLAYVSCTHVPVADPAVRDETIGTLESLLDLAGDLDCATLNVLAGGLRPRDADPATVDEHLVDVLRSIAPTAAANDVTVLVEHSNPIELPERYLTSADAAVSLLDRVDHPAVRFLLDVYHQQLSGGNVFGTIDAHHERIGHLHIAGVPGRRWPGAGELHYGNILRKLRAVGYEGYVECEFLAHEDPEGAIRAVRAMLESSG